MNPPIFLNKHKNNPDSSNKSSYTSNENQKNDWHKTISTKNSDLPNLPLSKISFITKKINENYIYLLFIYLILFLSFYLVFRAKNFTTFQTTITLSLSIALFFYLILKKNNPLLKKLPQLTGLILGGLVFLSIFNITIINPSYDDWLLLEDVGSGDTKFHYYGWLAYRQEGLQFPIGKIVSIGYPQTSVVFTDSIPLLAIILKPFNKILPTPFQYFGIWILICYMLMGHFSFKLLALYSQKIYYLIPSSLFFILSPIMTQRFICSHIALMAHFLIIASFYLFLKKKEKKDLLKWFLLLSSSLLTHLYLYALIFFIFLFYSITIIKKNNLFKILCYLVLISICQFFLIYISGYFIGTTNSGIASGGNEFGLCSSNLNSLINPLNYSRVLKSMMLPIKTPDIYVFNYLGLGIIVGLLIAITLSFFTRTFKRLFFKNFWLIFSSLILGFFSLSNKIRLNRNILFEYNIPNFFTFLTQFVATARFLWPLYYLVFLFIFITFAKLKKNSLFAIIILILLIFQTYELSSIYQEVTQYSLKEHTYNNLYLKMTFWEEVSKANSELSLIDLTDNLPDYQEFTIVAIKYNLKISNVRLARTTLEQDIHILKRKNEYLNGDLQRGVAYLSTRELYNKTKNLFNTSHRHFIVGKFDVVYLVP
ncbi:MAG TPA: DUF6311 domain-containing protein [Candidatus Woesearchaeota archaeon]|nr:DUF6311 domain-containing protein [Candidatus Woesearchaeota archaeon]